MKLITLTGLDGSGKSTQLSLLREHLESLGKNVAVFHAVEFSLASRMKRVFRNEKTFTPGKDTAITRASSLSIFLRKCLLFVDVFRFRSFRKKLERSGTHILLSDRYFYDSLLNLEYLSLEHGGTPARFLSLVEAIIEKPDLAFYVRATPEDIMQRDRVPEQGLSYLQQKFNILEHKKTDWHLIEIDASPEKEAVLKTILSNIPHF